MTTNCFFRILFRRSLQKPGDFEFSHRLSETPGDEILLDEQVVPGGRVELPTPAFSGPRSTGELPRHRSSEKIVRAREARSKRLEVRDLKMDGEISQALDAFRMATFWIGLSDLYLRTSNF
jgi:hypothetical protein